PARIGKCNTLEKKLSTIEIRRIELELIKKQGLEKKIIHILEDLVIKNIEEDR
ncbi:10657_t:CDS:1, partial [Gigaspora rosea]